MAKSCIRPIISACHWMNLGRTKVIGVLVSRFVTIMPERIFDMASKAKTVAPCCMFAEAPRGLETVLGCRWDHLRVIILG